MEDNKGLCLLRYLELGYLLFVNVSILIDMHCIVEDATDEVPIHHGGWEHHVSL